MTTSIPATGICGGDTLHTDQHPDGVTVLYRGFDRPTKVAPGYHKGGKTFPALDVPDERKAVTAVTVGLAGGTTLRFAPDEAVTVTPGPFRLFR